MITLHPLPPRPIPIVLAQPFHHGARARVAMRPVHPLDHVPGERGRVRAGHEDVVKVHLDGDRIPPSLLAENKRPAFQHLRDRPFFIEERAAILTDQIGVCH